jgi:hypothetical protein
MGFKVGLPQLWGDQVGVSLRCGDSGVPEEFLNAPQIGTALEQVGCERMADFVGRHLAVQNQIGVSLNQPDDSFAPQVFPSPVQEKVGAAIFVKERSALLQVAPQRFSGSAPQRH